MEKRNKLSLAIVTIILTSIIITGILTVKNMDEIISDLNGTSFFPSNPINKDNETINEGILDLFYTSDISSQTLLEKLLLYYGPPNSSLSIQHMWINLTGIDLVGKGINDFQLFNNTLSLELYSAQNSEKFFDSFNISEGTYSSIRIYFEKNLVVESEEGEFFNFEIQGTNFIVIPFMMNKGSTNQVDLNVHKNQKEKLYIDFSINLNLITNIVIINLQAFFNL